MMAVMLVGRKVERKDETKAAQMELPKAAHLAEMSAESMAVYWVD